MSTLLFVFLIVIGIPVVCAILIVWPFILWARKQIKGLK